MCCYRALFRGFEASLQSDPGPLIAKLPGISAQGIFSSRGLAGRVSEVRFFLVNINLYEGGQTPRHVSAAGLPGNGLCWKSQDELCMVPAPAFPSSASTAWHPDHSEHSQTTRGLIMRYFTFSAN